MPKHVDADADLILFAGLLRLVGPSVREFQEAGSYSSTSVADYHLKILGARGLIVQDSGRNYGWRLTSEGRRQLAQLGRRLTIEGVPI